MRENDMIYYKANKVGDNKIENADHQITSDVDKFSETFASVLSQSLKPILDFVVYSVELSRQQGLATPLALYAWFAAASAVLNSLNPKTETLSPATALTLSLVCTLSLVYALFGLYSRSTHCFLRGISWSCLRYLFVLSISV